MINPSIDSLDSKVDSKYTLVSLAAKRARQIVDGDNIKLDGLKTSKPVSLALYEINNKKIDYIKTKVGIK